jgi:thiazole synthase ThiGH ThiG subunit
VRLKEFEMDTSHSLQRGDIGDEHTLQPNMFELIEATSQLVRDGFDAVLLNTAVVQGRDPVAMAQAFRLAIEADRLARHSGLIAAQDFAVASTPVSGEPMLLGAAP